VGEVGSEEAVGGGFGGVELLGVGGVAQELPQPGRLGTSRAERVVCSFEPSRWETAAAAASAPAVPVVWKTL
jgi:hypothetical protein